jgi:hypothetical protein
MLGWESGPEYRAGRELAARSVDEHLHLKRQSSGACRRLSLRNAMSPARPSFICDNPQPRVCYFFNLHQDIGIRIVASCMCYLCLMAVASMDAGGVGHPRTARNGHKCILQLLAGHVWTNRGHLE